MYFVQKYNFFVKYGINVYLYKNKITQNEKTCIFSVVVVLHVRYNS